MLQKIVDYINRKRLHRLLKDPRNEDRIIECIGRSEPIGRRILAAMTGSLRQAPPVIVAICWLSMEEGRDKDRVRQIIWKNGDGELQVADPAVQDRLIEELQHNSALQRAVLRFQFGGLSLFQARSPGGADSDR